MELLKDERAASWFTGMGYLVDVLRFSSDLENISQA
jgi:hypothetical protein